MFLCVTWLSQHAEGFSDWNDVKVIWNLKLQLCLNHEVVSSCLQCGLPSLSAGTLWFPFMFWYLRLFSPLCLHTLLGVMQPATVGNAPP